MFFTFSNLSSNIDIFLIKEGTTQAGITFFWRVYFVFEKDLKIPEFFITKKFVLTS